MKIALALAALVIGSIIFHFMSPWYLTPIASNWDSIDNTIDITFWVTGFVFVAVNLFLAYAVFRFQYKKNNKAHYQPENKRLEIGLTVITAIGVAAMLAPGLLVWAKFVEKPENAAVVEVIGQQWEWSYRLPGLDGQLGKVGNNLITQTNPFGLDERDPAGQDDILVSSNELHISLNQPLIMLLRSKDVLHNFTVPPFRVKMDLVPGTVTSLWFTPTKAGTFEVLCEELCGLAHHTMRGRVVVESPDSFQRWLAAQTTFAQSQTMAAADPDRGRDLFVTCAACHGQKGEGNIAMNAPRLGGLSGPYIARQLGYYQAGVRGVHVDDLFGQQMRPMAGLLVDWAAIRDVAAYIAQLPHASAAPTIKGNARNGQAHYVTCSTCHGKKAEGKPGLNAPKLAGQHDWYLKRQLSNFKLGIRGEHPDDRYGFQMRLMSKLLNSEQAIDDLVSYIDTLEPANGPSKL